MRRLYLLRHAKSSWDQPNLEDHDRPLAPRGERAGRAMAPAVAALDPPPDLVLCSTAVRARQTLELVRAGLPDGPVEIESAVYTFEPLPLRQRLEALDDAVGAVLVVGHNPALELLVQDLARDDDGPAMARLRRKLPTAALVTLDLPVAHWRDIAAGGGRLAGFIRPADLDGG
ncbi:SixA phosphatase family protein [Roseospira goensis]|uniref:Phosphohistidine phosphatase n=1 Tax=Roseospira goensis TaxID=391922 RepID=A0A7W6S0T1_9PROT|nr:histidine phosphatase family protein [Roseospira goensis]MBB4286631.1 phosphohistidine phosphatase [Roseospira goensis]